jgi:hypothetical protein
VALSGDPLLGDPLPPAGAGGLPAPPDDPLALAVGLELGLGLGPTSVHEVSSTIALPGSALPPTPDRSVKRCGQGIRGVVQITLDPATR